MKIVFLGTSNFSATILEKLISGGFIPEVVVCNPDRPRGRKHIITPPETKVIASTFNIPVLQPEKIDGKFINIIKSINPDLMIVAAYSKILPNDMLETPRFGAIGIHPSLLPKYRGPSPIQSAILSGEKHTGVTIYLLDEKADHGPIIAEKTVEIGEEDNYETLMEKLSNVGGDLLLEILPKIVDNNIKPEKQDDKNATYTKMITTEDAFVKEEDLAEAKSGRNIGKAKLILRKIKALNPEPGVWTIIGGKRIKLLSALIDGNKKLKLLIIQKEGEKPKHSDI